MKKKLFLILSIILSINAYSQVKFEKGYFINNKGEKTECLIKNIGWKNSPTKFEYKLTENTQSKTVTIESIVEFGISQHLKYVRYSVQIDKPKSEIDEGKYSKNLDLIEKTLFLKLLIKGKASLYLYENSNLRRYYYSLDNSKPNILIHKKYVTTITGKVSKEIIDRHTENNEYKQQLWNVLKCDNITLNNIKNIGYKEVSLSNYFVKYNNCTKSDFVKLNKKSDKDLFNFSIRVGLNKSSLSIENPISSSKSTDFGDNTNLNLGIELEYVLPFNKNKWSVFIQPTYQYFKAENELKYYYNDFDPPIVQNAIVNYSFIEFPVGIRHYFFLNDNSKIFFNIAYVPSINYNSKIKFEKSNNLDISSNSNLAFGLGYNYNNKYSLEVKYNTKRNILGDYIAWSSNYSSFSVIFGYTIF